MSKSAISNLVLRVLLGLIGLAIILLGLNVGLGGISTLGWQGPTDFISVTDSTAFGNQDNHVRFLGGFWLAAGLVMLTGAFALRRLRLLLMGITGMVFIGGLMRLSVLDPSVFFEGSIAPSLLTELVGFPLLGLWIAQSTKPNAAPNNG